LCTALLLGMLTLGCGSGDGRKPVYPAKGKVVGADGKPLAGAIVTLHPTEALTDHRHKPAGMADEEGNFTLGTYTETDGAPAGDYVVTVEWRRVRKSPMEPVPPDRLGGKFSNPKSSQLKQTIVKGENRIEVKLP
jgi:hypothetical protein